VIFGHSSGVSRVSRRWGCVEPLLTFGDPKQPAGDFALDSRFVYVEHQGKIHRVERDGSNDEHHVYWINGQGRFLMRVAKSARVVVAAGH
jgi:hypothetical protein